MMMLGGSFFLSIWLVTLTSLSIVCQHSYCACIPQMDNSQVKFLLQWIEQSGFKKYNVAFYRPPAQCLSHPTLKWVRS